MKQQSINKELIKKFFLYTGITSFLFVFVCLCLEIFFYYKCRQVGLLDQTYHYGLKMNAYYSTSNTPDFTFRAYNALFGEAELRTDPHSFVTDMPIAIKKPENTIRIVLAGASAMFGNIQNKTYVSSDNYPEGVYCYSASIAGCLKQKLQKKFPNGRFEVINAAVSAHGFHQTWQMYIAKLHAFKPDIVVNMDGNNDGWGYFTGNNFEDPYKEMERRALMDLELKCRESKFPFTLSYYRYWLEHHSRILLKEKGTQVPVAYGPEDYKKIEPLMIENSKTTLWAIAAHEQMMQADSVFSIRVLQPLLLRKVHQKELSSLEKDFMVQLDKSLFFEDSTLTRMRSTPYGVLKDKLSEIHNIGFGWFFDNYFSHAEDSIVRLYGGTFIDMNKKISHLKSGNEFYVDYCHLTPFGNAFVAEQLMLAMEDFVRKKFLSSFSLTTKLN